MAEDRLKLVVLRQVQNDLARTAGEIESTLGPHASVEHNDVAPSETVLRIDDCRRSGAPRYFRVKVSEML